MKFIYQACVLIFTLLTLSCKVRHENFDVDINDIIVHDPCILADHASKTYYLYGQYSPKRDYERIQPPAKRGGVQVYKSKDLKHWTEPRLVFSIPDNFWADSIDAPWAPEVHFFNGKYYLFVTFNDWSKKIEEKTDRPPITLRRSQILIADTPEGPFKPFKNEGTTPKGEMTLDATFYNEDGTPWMIYCHEWIQVGPGMIKAIKLSPDLSETEGEPFTLLCAGDAEWTKDSINYKGGIYSGTVTDGPYLYKSKTNHLLMTWSSWGPNQYAVAVARSRSGKITGPWELLPGTIMEHDRGHGMIFKTFDGEIRFFVHKYFHQPATRVQIYELNDLGNSLEIGEKLFGAE